jgi:3'-phosphoadenosine 5'-phosphosulfate sulfotransferase (PAPS reductase)/FAD synthetase
MFPSRIRRFCTDELKVKPLQKHLQARMDAGDDVLNVVGIRAEESDARSRLPEWEWQEGFDCQVWRPILRWTLDDVVAIHARHGLTPNPLYLRGVKRVGCWPCINCSKSEIRFMAQTDPHRVVRLRVLESNVELIAQQRAARSGKLLAHPPAWFQCPTGEKTAEGKRSGACWPIDRVVAWAKTIRGGKEEDRQELLFASMNDGCMRWGLCDTGAGK